MAYEMNWAVQSGYLSNHELSMDFQRAAQPRTKFRQFVQIKEAFGKHKGQSVNWRKVSNASDYGGVLTETQTMHETTQPLTWGTLTVNEYGLSIPHTFKVEALSKFDVMEIVKGSLLDDAVKVIDGVVEREFNKTPLRYVGTATDGYALTTNSTAATTNTSALNSYHLRKMITELKKRNVPSAKNSGGDYAGILSIEAMESLNASLETVSSYVESGYTKLLNGEQGRFYGCRLVEDSFASRNVYDSTARTATAVTWTQSKSGVAYFFGGPTVREAVVVPEEIRMKVTTDYGRSKGIGWYGLFGWKIEWDTAADARIIKWDSAA